MAIDVGKVYTVFVCGPYGDLTDEREAVINVLEKLRLRHNCMEFFGARAESSIEVSLSEVGQSDIVVVIIGHKYGNIVPNTKISYSEAEYREGYRLNRPCLVYLKDEGVPVPPKYIERDPQKFQALDAFKKLLKERHTVYYFKNPADLASSVAIDLLRLIQELAKTRIEVPEKLPTPAPITMRRVWNLRMHHDQPVTSLYHLQGHLPWAQDVERVTNSMVKVTIYPVQTIVRSVDAWEGVKSGVADIAWIFPGLFPGKFDVSDSITLPFVIPNGEIGSRVAWRLYQKFDEIQAQMADVKTLSVCTTEPYFLITNKKLVKTLEDLKGLKIRTTVGPSTDMVKLLGGAPILVPMPETYIALQTGVIDGILASASPVRDFRLYEVANYYTYVPTTCAYFMLVMNKDIWNKMPVDIQQAIASVSGETQATRYGRVFDIAHKELPEIAKAAGFDVNEYALPPEEVSRWIKVAGKPVWNSWVKNMETKGHKNALKILEDTINMVKEFTM